MTEWASGPGRHPPSHDAPAERADWGLAADSVPPPFVLASLRHRLLSGGAWAFAGKVLGVVMGLAVSALLARLLSPSDMGAYFLAFSIVSVAAMVARMGLENVAVKMVAERVALGYLTSARRVLRPVYVLAAVGAVTVGAAVCFGVGPWLAGNVFRSPALRAVTPVLGVWVAALTFQILIAETFRGLHDIRMATLLGPTAPATLSAVVFCIFWMLTSGGSLRMGVEVSAGAVVVTVLVATVILRRSMRRLRAGPDHRSGIGTVAQQAWPLLVTNGTAVVATQADLWIVGAFRPESEVAVYGAAARLVLLVSISLTIANQVLPPFIGELSVRNQRARLQRLLQGTAAVVAIPGLAMLVLFVAFGGTVLTLTFGPHYRNGALVLGILGTGRFVGVCVGACEFTLIMTGHQRVLAMTTLLTAMAIVGGSLAVVRPFGMLGVAVVSACTITLQQLALLCLARLQTGVWTHARPAVLLHALHGMRDRGLAWRR